MEPKGRAVIGMSGGVDSSVAAYFLKQAGYEVVGITMKVWQKCMSHAEEKCCGPQAVADARNVCHALGLPHYVIDEAGDFEKIVIDYFTSEYQKGRTPNPCVMCNEHMKFGSLQRKALNIGAGFVATGHYAIIEERDGRMILRKGADERKDQSYFLFSLGQEQLRRSLMPLGDKTKPEIRAIARELGLKVYDKEDSFEICFVPGNDYAAFLEKRLGTDQFHKGGIYDLKGNFLGDHEGIERFTIGQRKGLGGGSVEPRYVVDIDPATSRVIVGGAEDLLTREFHVNNTHWISIETLTGPQEVTAKIRYAHKGTAATLRPGSSPHEAVVTLHEPQRAVTPGQACVFYQGDVVVGGGWIMRDGRYGPNES
ncbi:MAG: tRNA 2-thiouridine(34) synthase MnmA [Verrucomicrobiae bacterium]|nr:tRNA 2-thiouridine(34) synthase MnmA [Verrucomicrobiae bacterium]